MVSLVPSLNSFHYGTSIVAPFHVLSNKGFYSSQQMWPVFNSGSIPMRIEENSQATGSKDLGMRSERVWGDIMTVLAELFGFIEFIGEQGFKRNNAARRKSTRHFFGLAYNFKDHNTIRRKNKTTNTYKINGNLRIGTSYDKL